ncbi:MAG TPA: polysaccharide biosynthesis C-terminal domain-containing protein, partial [Ferruginibacter sp.]|nr:polysaccharide biosynthesis C-terminal domain-containing protein [Ferruginibacter sp.]
VNYLGSESSSSFFYLLNNLFFAVVLLTFGMDAGMSYYNARKERSTSYLFSLAVIWVFAATFLFILAVNIFSGFGIRLFPANNAFISMYIFGSLATTFFSAIFFTQHDSKTPNLVAAILNIILILLLPNMPWNKMTFETYSLFYFSATLLSAMILMGLLLRQKVSFSIREIRSSSLKHLLRFSFHSFILSGLFFLLKSSDFWLVKNMCLPAAAGNYFQASKVIQVLIMLPAMATFSLYPLIIQSIQVTTKQETEMKVLKLVYIYFMLAMVLGLMLLISGFWLFPKLYGADFDQMYVATVILIPGLLCFAASYPLSTYFSGKDRNTVTIKAIGLSIIVMLLLNLLLIPRFSINGAAISSSVANIFYFTFLMIYFMKENKLSMHNLYRQLREQLNWAHLFQQLFRY